MPKTTKNLAILLTVTSWLAPALGGGKNVDAGAVETTRTEPMIFWRDPSDIASRNLFYGPGGRDHQPRGPFMFVKEDREGSNPKFTVTGSDGVEWKAKLGVEARPETVATRIVWAIGYAADQDYFLDEIHVSGLPEHLHRGQSLVGAGGSIRNVRLEREQKGHKLGTWKWKRSPFEHTREFNALRVVMAVINDWDLKDANNSRREIATKTGKEQVFYISDLGATFGTNAIARPRSKSKGDLCSYQESAFIKKITPDYIDFATPKRPPVVFLVSPFEFMRRVHLDWIGHRIPRADARWTGELLGRLSVRQIEDAFRAAGYSPWEIEGFTKVVRSRIEELEKL